MEKNDIRKSMRIVVIEDDEVIRDLVSFTLESAGYAKPRVAVRGDEGLELVRRERPDVLILDLMLPGLDGITVCRRLRALPELAGLGIVMLTAKAESEDIVAGLDAGADDYVTKPFSRSVLLARIAALARRLEPRPAGGLELDGLRVDVTDSAAFLDGRPLVLSRTEFVFLAKFIAHPLRVYTRRQLAEMTGASGESERSVDVQIAGLRKKLGAWAEHIETIRGVGYRVRA